VIGTLSETSTGTGHPIKAIGAVVAKTDAVFLVDGISGVGAMECKTDEWGVDLLCVGSQKAMMLPPGLSFVSVSPKAWAKIESFEAPTYYFNLKSAKKKAAEFDTPFTPAHTLILALRASVRRILAEGLDNASIAGRLFLSPKTVRNHVSNVFAKIDAPDRPGAIVLAHRQGLGT